MAAIKANEVRWQAGAVRNYLDTFITGKHLPRVACSPRSLIIRPVRVDVRHCATLPSVSYSLSDEDQFPCIMGLSRSSCLCTIPFLSPTISHYHSALNTTTTTVCAAAASTYQARISASFCLTLPHATSAMHLNIITL